MIRQLLVVLAAFAMVWYAVNVPADQMNLVKQVSNGNITETQTKSSSMKVGGFPWRYCEFQDTDPLEVRIYRNWSKSNLIWNICAGLLIATALAVLIVGHKIRTKKKAADSVGQKKKGGLQISLSGLLATITVVAAVFGYYRDGTQRITDDLNAFAHQGGSCNSTLVAPRWLANAIDLSFTMHVQRGHIDRNTCSASDIARIAKMKSLVRLSVTGASSSDVCSIAALPELKSLGMTEIPMDDAIIHAIDANTAIGSLSYIATSHTPPLPMLKKLFSTIADRSGRGYLSLSISPDKPLTIQDVPGLTTLAVAAFTEGGPNAWEQVSNIRDEALRRLRLTSEPVDEFDKQTDKLQNENDQQEISLNYSVVFSDLPDLAKLSLQTPLSTLGVKNLPKLEHLDLDFSGVSERLVLQDLPKLKTLKIGQAFPKMLEIENAPLLDLHNLPRPN